MAHDNSQASLNRLKGKVALITGVARSRGMGNCVARLFAKEGASVVIVDIADQVKNCENELQQDGYTAFSFQVDLTDLKQVKDLVDKSIRQYEKIDILVNVAGKSVPPRPSFLDMSEDYWNMVMDRNLTTTLNCCWAVLPLMVKQKYGKVVNFSSVTGPKTAYRYSAAYAASKGAVSALTRALALEMGEHNITVNAILPGDIDTGDRPWSPEDGRRDLGVLMPHLSGPIPRPGKSEEVADLALFLATDESRFITGAEIVIDGGITIVEPGVSGPQD
jgi:NAD(P)-dependent dehydrogenase (short-subunit alcohol dehydrogenase family)